jgi:hypothetical protein
MQLSSLLVAAMLILTSRPSVAGWRALDSSSNSSAAMGRNLQAMPLKTCYDDKLPLEVG